MVHNLRFLIVTFLFLIYYSPTLSLAVCPSKINPTANPNLIGKCKRIPKQTTPPKVVKTQDPLEIIKELFKTIKDDPYNHSYADMLEDVKAEHSIKYHKANAPFFYSNDSFVMKDIIDLLLDDPDGYVDETKTKGILMVYRDNNYHEEIEELFDREPLYRRDIPQPKKFQKDYLGQIHTGPTNRVMVTLKIKGDEQNENTLEKRLAYIGNNILFVDAFPAQRPPPPPKPKAPQNAGAAKPEEGAPKKTGQASAKNKGVGAEEGTPEAAKTEEGGPEATKADDGNSAEPEASEEPKADEAAPEAAKTDEAAPETAKTEESPPEAAEAAPETVKTEETGAEKPQGEEPKAAA